MSMDGAGKRKDPEGVEENGTNGHETSIVAVNKRQKTGKEITLAEEERQKALSTSTTVQRTSKLQAPIMLLTGHKAEVFGIKFSPSGERLISCSFDKTIFMWDVYGECENRMVLRGHSSAVLEVHWSTGEDYIFSASADKSAAVWDARTGERLKKCKGHQSFVNTCSPARRGPQLLLTGSDDRTVKLWDVRVKGALNTLNYRFPVTAVTFSDQSDQIYAGGVDNVIKCWDVRKMESSEPVMTLEAHEDTITGVKLSPDGSYLLSNAMDNTVRIWDIRPYVQGHRNIKMIKGLQHNFEKTLLKCSWSPDGSKVSAGSADRFVYVWDTATCRILYKLPGHRGTVGEVDFHPKEPIIGSCSNDTTIYLGEIKP